MNINLGRMVWSLAIESGQFAQQLAQVGRSVSGLGASTIQTTQKIRSALGVEEASARRTQSRIAGLKDEYTKLQAQQAKIATGIGVFERANEATKRLGAELQRSRDGFAGIAKALNEANGDIFKFNTEFQDLLDRAMKQRTVYQQVRAEAAKAAAEQFAAMKRLKDAMNAEAAGTGTRQQTQQARGQAVTSFRQNQLAQQAASREGDVYRKLIADMTAAKAAQNEAEQSASELTAAYTKQYDSMRRLESQYKSATDAVERNKDAYNRSQETLIDVSGAIDRVGQKIANAERKGSSEPFLNRLAAGVKQVGQVFAQAEDGMGRFTRSVERMSRGVRGVPAPIRGAQEQIYSLDQALKQQTARVAQAEQAYSEYALTIIARTEAIKTAELRLQERRDLVAQREANLVVERRTLAEIEARGDRELANAQKARITALETNLLKSKQAVNETAAYLERTRASLNKLDAEQERARRYVEAQKDRYSQLGEAMRTAKDRINELTSAHQESIAKKKQEAEASRRAKVGTDEESNALAQLWQRFQKLFGAPARVASEAQQLAKSEQVLVQNTQIVTVHLQQAAEALSNFHRFLLNTAAVAVGNTVSNFFMTISSALGSIPGQAFGAVKSFDQLTFSLNTLMAREVRRNNPLLSLQEAMEQTKARTADFVDSLETLAVKSTYTSEQVTGIFQNFLRNFQSDIALKMTQTVSSFGDALTMSSYDLEGVATALGQIQTKGKVSLEELNQLQERNVTALQYLAKGYGVTTAKMGEMISKGQILAEDAIPVIVKAMQDELGGAGEMASQTLGGLTSSIEDLSQRVLRKLFGPTIREVVQPLLSKFVDTLGNEALISKIESLGEALASGIGGALNFVSGFLPAVTAGLDGLMYGVETVLGYLGAFGIEAYTWGEELIGAFIDGMMSKVDSLTSVINYFSDMLAYWFEPHSPPKVAPQIDKWGTETGKQFFKGLGEADGTADVAAVGDQLNGLQPGDAQAGTGGAASGGGVTAPAASGPLSPVAEQTNLLSTIADTLRQMLAIMTQGTGNAAGGSGSSRSLSGAKNRQSGDTPLTGPVSSEEYRQRLEQQLGTQGKATSVLDKTTKSQLAYLKSIGDTSGAMDILEEKLQGVEEGSKDYYDIQKQLVDLEKAQEREDKKKGPGGSKGPGKGVPVRPLKLPVLGGGPGGPGVPDIPAEPPGGVNPVSKIEGMIDQARQRIQAKMEQFRQTLKPITDWIDQYRGAIGYLLTSLAIGLARSFIVSRILPILKEFWGILKLLGISITQLITPMNLLKLGIQVLAIAWIRNIGGMRDIFNEAFRDISPELTKLWGIFRDAFSGPGGILGMFNRLTDQLPQIQTLLSAILDRMAKAFVDWIGPIGNLLVEKAKAAFEQLSKWLLGDGASGFENNLNKWFLDLQAYLEGKTPQTFLVGVLARLTVFVVTMSGTLLAGAFAAISSIVIAYAPRIGRLMEVWIPQFVGWINKTIPPALVYLSGFLAALAGGVASGAIELARILGLWTIKLAGWILPAIPDMLSRLGDFLAIVVAWFINAGIPQLANGLGQWVEEALKQLGDQLPSLGLNLGRAFGRLFSEVVVLGLNALYNAAVWTPTLITWVFTKFLPGAAKALWGAARGLAAIIPGIFLGILEPAIDALRAGQLFQRLHDWANSLGIDFVTAFVTSIGFELPKQFDDLVGWFDQMVVVIKDFFGMTVTADERVNALVASIRGLSTESQKVVGTIQTVITWLGSFALATGAVVAQQYIMSGAITATLIPNLLKFAATLQTQALAALGIHIRTLETATGTMVIWSKTGIAGAIESMIVFARTMWTNVVTALGGMITALRTGGIPALLQYIGSMNAAGAASTGFVLKTALMVGAIAAIGLAIAGVVMAWQNFQNKVKAATDQLLESRKWWNDSTKAMDRYGNASEAVQKKLYNQAEAVKNLRDQIHGEIESLGTRMSAGIVTQEQYQKEMDAINAKSEQLKLMTTDLDKSITVEEKAAKANADHAQALADLEAQARQTSSAINDEFTRQVETEAEFLSGRSAAIRDHEAEVADITAQLAKATTDQEKADLQARLDQEQTYYTEREQQQALSYVKERAEQRTHLGEMLIEYIKQQQVLLGWNEKRTAELVDAVAQQYGVQQTISEKASLDIQGAIQSGMKDTNTSVDQILGRIGEIENKSTDAQQAIDELTKQRTLEIVQKYTQQGKYDPEALKRELDNLPRSVAIEIAAKLKADVTSATGVQGDRRHGGIVEDDSGPQAPPPPKPATKPTTGGGRASGGPIRKGTPYRVGEVGEEIIVPKEDGVVIPNRLSAALGRVGGDVDRAMQRVASMMSGGVGSAVSGRSSSGVSISVPVTISGNTVRNDSDLIDLERRVTTNFIRALDTLVLQGMKGV